MKHQNKFPIDSISGTYRRDNTEIWYKWRDLQVSRAYAAPNNSENIPFNVGTITATYNANFWTNLDPDHQRLWQNFASAWNRQIGDKYQTYSAYSAFLSISYYRNLCGEITIDTPPAVHPFRHLYILDVYEGSPPGTAGTIRFALSETAPAGTRALIKICRPTIGADSRPLESTLKMINGSSASSAPFIDIAQEPYECDVSSWSEFFLAGRWVKIFKRILEADYFPQPGYSIVLQISEEEPMISTGTKTIYHTIGDFLSSLGADNPGNEGFFWDPDNDHRSLITKLTGSKLRLRIPYNPGSILDWGTINYLTSSATCIIYLDLICQLVGGPTPAYSTVESFQFTGASGDQVGSFPLSAPLTLVTGGSYFLELSVYLPTSEYVSLYGFGLRTTQRSY